MRQGDYRPLLNKPEAVLRLRLYDWNLPWYPEEVRAWFPRLDREMQWCFGLGQTEALLLREFRMLAQLIPKLLLHKEIER